MEREPLIETAKENTRELVQDIAEHPNIDCFLKNEDVHLNVRATNATALEQTTLLEYDFSPVIALAITQVYFPPPLNNWTNSRYATGTNKTFVLLCRLP